MILSKHNFVMNAICVYYRKCNIRKYKEELVWRATVIIPALQKPRQEDHKFQANLDTQPDTGLSKVQKRK